MNALLITFDSLSAADMSLYGCRQRTTPNIDAFSRTCIIFESAFASCNSTRPSLWSIIAGRYPYAGNWPKRLIPFISRLKGEETVIGSLKASGYRVGAVVSVRHGLFLYDSANNVPVPRFKPCFSGKFIRSGMGFQKTPSLLEMTFCKAREFLSKARSPFFLWVHVYKPHEPYVPSGEFLYTFLKEKTFTDPRSQLPYLYRPYGLENQPLIDKLRNRYNEQILEVDDAFGRFFSHGAVRTALDSALIVLTADHGELFEKGYQGHDGPFLHRAVVHIPLILKFPGAAVGLSNIPAGHVDIAPTILDMLDVPVPAPMEGISLETLTQRPSKRERAIYSLSETFSHGGIEARRGSISLTDGIYRYIQSGPERFEELYNVQNDVKEKYNIREDHRLISETFQERIRLRFHTCWAGT